MVAVGLNTHHQQSAPLALDQLHRSSNHDCMGSGSLFRSWPQVVLLSRVQAGSGMHTVELCGMISYRCSDLQIPGCCTSTHVPETQRPRDSETQRLQTPGPEACSDQSGCLIRVHRPILLAVLFPFTWAGCSPFRTMTPHQPITHPRPWQVTQAPSQVCSGI